jgi:dTMP kinase
VFISFEGIDGAGKSTHLQAVQSWCERQGRRVIRTREPGGTPLAEQLRALVLHHPMDALTEALLVFGARRDHVCTVIQPALAEGQIVLSDRFTDASFAYQGGGRGLDIEVLEQLEAWVHPGCQPDLVLWFDADPALAEARRVAVRAADRFEAQDTEFFHRVRAAYLRRMAKAPERWIRIDASEPPAAVEAAVLATLAARWIP